MTIESNTDQKGKKGLNATQIILIIGFTLVLVAIGLVAWYLLNNNNKPAEMATEEVGNQLVTEENVASIQQSLDDQVADGMFTTYMNTSWTFPDSKTASKDAIVGNSSDNKYKIYFEVLLGEEREQIFKSGLIPIGSKIGKIKLTKELPAGVYDAICMYHLMGADGTEKSSTGVNVRLVIEQ